MKKLDQHKTVNSLFKKYINISKHTLIMLSCLVLGSCIIIGALTVSLSIFREDSSNNTSNTNFQGEVMERGINVLAGIIFIPCIIFHLKIMINAISDSFLDAFSNFKYELNYSTRNTNVANYQSVKGKTVKPHRYKLLAITEFIFSRKTHEDVFKPIMSDWDYEIFENEEKAKIWNARWISFRYTYHFLLTMWQKSPIGDLIEFVVKIAKG